MRTTPIADVLVIRRGRRLMGACPPPAATFVNLELDADSYSGVSFASWAAMLAAPAAAGWTPRDLNQLITDWLGIGRHIPDHPPRPIALLEAILAWHGTDNLSDRPAVADIAREIAERADHHARINAQATEHAEHIRARETGRAALNSPGHAAARAEAMRLAAQRRTATTAAEQAHLETLIRERRISS